MTRGLLVALSLLLAAQAWAGRVRGYVKKNGAFVAPSYRTKANRTRADNYSSKGNVNPFTGAKGSKDPYAPRKR